MTELEAKRNVKLYGWYIVFGEFLFIGPTMILYLQQAAKMTLSEIYMMEAIVVGGLVFLEIPTGALADLIGRRKTIIASTICLLISIVILSIAVSPIYVWISNIFWMVGLSLSSGADSAFLYDSLKKMGKEKEYKQVAGRAYSNLFLAMAICSLLAGVMSKISIRLPFILSIPIAVASCILAYKFKEPITTAKYCPKKQLSLMADGLLFAIRHREIKWIIAFAILIGVSSKIWFFTYNPYFELVNLDVAYYGVMFFFMNIIGWFFSRHASILEEKTSERFCIIAAIALICFPIILMGSIVSKIMISMVLLQNIVRGFMQPFLEGFINHRIEADNRATVISVKSTFVGLASLFFLYLFGLLLKVWPLALSLQILGCTTLLAGIVLIMKYKKIPKIIKGPH